jgi:hypothetical protein
MSELRTDNLLNDFLDKEYTWRIKELSIIKSSIPKEKNPLQNTLLRAAITLLYAHWEGFIRAGANGYYQFLTYQRGHKIKELETSLIGILVKKEMDEFTETNKLYKSTVALHTLVNKLNNEAFLPNYAPLKTSNLNYEIFRDACLLTNVNIGSFELTEKFIDEELLTRRNTIAHGKRLDIQLTDFEEVYRKVIEIMTTFKTEVSNSAALKRYLQPTKEFL